MFNLFKNLFATSKNTVSPSVAVQKINAGALVIDVREPAEFADGSVQNAINVPLSVIDRHGAAAVCEIKDITGNDVVLICRSGARSGAACARLQEVLGDRAFNLEGGLMAWHSAGLPLVSTKG